MFIVPLRKCPLRGSKAIFVAYWMQFSTEFANFINFAIIMEKSMIQVEFNVQAKRAMFHPGCLLENKGNKILLKAVICKACAMIFYLEYNMF